MLDFLFPDYRFDSILDISREWLRKRGLRTLFLDVDNTLKLYRSPVVEEKIVDWIREMKRQNIRFYLISNGRRKRIRQVAKQLNISYVASAFKPFPFVCRKLIKTKGLDPNYVAMVGDQIFADIIAGNLANISTIYIKPMAPKQEPFFTRIKRPFERLVLRFYRDDSYQD